MRRSGIFFAPTGILMQFEQFKNELRKYQSAGDGRSKYVVVPPKEAIEKMYRENPSQRLVLSGFFTNKEISEVKKKYPELDFDPEMKYSVPRVPR